MTPTHPLVFLPFLNFQGGVLNQLSGEEPNGPACECLQKQTWVQGGERILLPGHYNNPTQQGNYYSSQKVTTLLLPVQFTFEECFLQEHGKKAVQSYRRAGQLNFGEKRCKKKHALKVDRSALMLKAEWYERFQWPIAGTKRCNNCTKSVTLR